MDENGTKPGVAAENTLPAADTKRWVARRKAVIVSAVRSGALSLEEACRRYQLSVEEFHAWQQAIEAHGVAGLLGRASSSAAGSCEKAVGVRPAGTVARR